MAYVVTRIQAYLGDTWHTIDHMKVSELKSIMCSWCIEYLCSYNLKGDRHNVLCPMTSVSVKC